MIGWPEPYRATQEVGTPATERWTSRLAHQHVGQVPLGLDLLKAELAVAEDLIDELLGEDPARLDVGDDVLLERLGLRAGRCQRDRRGLGRFDTAAPLGEHRRDSTRERRDHERQDTSYGHGRSPLFRRRAPRMGRAHGNGSRQSTCCASCRNGPSPPKLR